MCKEVGIPVREVRLLDPQLANAAALLCRERALLVNLEHLQCIITQDAVLLANANHPGVRPCQSPCLAHALEMPP